MTLVNKPPYWHTVFRHNKSVPEKVGGELLRRARMKAAVLCPSNGMFSNRRLLATQPSTPPLETP
jgi:hypothetical protein